MKIAEFKALQYGTISSRYLECNKSYDGYIQEPQLKILVRFQSGHKGLWVPPPQPGFIISIHTTRCAQLLN